MTYITEKSSTQPLLSHPHPSPLQPDTLISLSHLTLTLLGYTIFFNISFVFLYVCFPINVVTNISDFCNCTHTHILCACSWSKKKDKITVSFQQRRKQGFAVRCSNSWVGCSSLSAWLGVMQHRLVILSGQLKWICCKQCSQILWRNRLDFCWKAKIINCYQPETCVSMSSWALWGLTARKILQR